MLSTEVKARAQYLKLKYANADYMDGLAGGISPIAVFFIGKELAVVDDATGTLKMYDPDHLSAGPRKEFKPAAGRLGPSCNVELQGQKIFAITKELKRLYLLDRDLTVSTSYPVPSDLGAFFLYHDEPHFIEFRSPKEVWKLHADGYERSLLKLEPYPGTMDYLPYCFLTAETPGAFYVDSKIVLLLEGDVFVKKAVLKEIPSRLYRMIYLSEPCLYVAFCTGIFPFQGQSELYLYDKEFNFVRHISLKDCLNGGFFDISADFITAVASTANQYVKLFRYDYNRCRECPGIIDKNNEKFPNSN